MTHNQAPSFSYLFGGLFFRPQFLSSFIQSKFLWKLKIKVSGINVDEVFPLSPWQQAASSWMQLLWQVKGYLGVMGDGCWVGGLSGVLGKYVNGAVCLGLCGAHLVVVHSNKNAPFCMVSLLSSLNDPLWSPAHMDSSVHICIRDWLKILSTAASFKISIISKFAFFLSLKPPKQIKYVILRWDSVWDDGESVEPLAWC